MSYPPPPPPGQQPPYGYPPSTPPDHPRSTTVLILGIVSLVVCGLVGPFAWFMGRTAVREIDASGGAVGGRSQAQIGMILGIIATALMALALLFVVLLVLLAIAGSA